LLEVYGIPVYSADEESKRLLVASPQLRQQLTALLGDSIYEAGELNRRRMASLIFNDANLLAQTNAVVHPEVNRHFRAWVERQTTKYAVLESAILFEAGFDRYVDFRLMIYAPRELRIRRVITRDRITEAEVLQRMQHQLPDEEKIKRADFVIYNDDKQALIPQIEKLMEELKAEWIIGKKSEH
jgi:dephospho-CoA kinase